MPDCDAGRVPMGPFLHLKQARFEAGPCDSAHADRARTVIGEAGASEGQPARPVHRLAGGMAVAWNRFNSKTPRGWATGSVCVDLMCRKSREISSFPSSITQSWSRTTLGQGLTAALSCFGLIDRRIRGATSRLDALYTFVTIDP